MDCVNTDPELRPTSTEVAKRVMKIQAAYKENPTEWANTKSGISRNKTSNSGTSTPTQNNYNNTPRDDSFSGAESRTSLHDSRPEVSKALSDSPGKRVKRGSSQPISPTPGYSSERLAKAASQRSGIEFHSLSDDDSNNSDNSYSDNSNSDNNSNNSDGELRSSKNKKPISNSSSNSKLKVKKKKQGDEDVVGSSAYISGNSSSSDVKTGKKKEKEKEKEKEEKKESAEISDKITSPRKKLTRKTHKNTKTKVKIILVFLKLFFFGLCAVGFFFQKLEENCLYIM